MFLARNFARLGRVALGTPEIAYASKLTNITNHQCSILKSEPNFITPIFLINKRDYSAKKGKDKGGKVAKPKTQLTNQEINVIINNDEFINGLENAVEHLKKEYDDVNIRINPSTLEAIPVKINNKTVKLGEIAQVQTKAANTFQIDLIENPEYVKPVSLAIAQANMNLNPQTDKSTITLKGPSITRESRENVVKQAKTKCENALKKMRDVEHKVRRKTKDTKEVSADLKFNVNEYIMYQFKIYSKKASDLRDAKIKEILND